MTQTGATPDDAAQHGFTYRFAWGPAGLEALAPHCDVVVVVDVLRFTTAVSAAVDRGAVVFPYRWRDSSAVAYATERRAELAGRRADGPVSLSPTDLQRLEPGSRIVLPSPNGSTLAHRACELEVPFVLAGSLRNAAATARRALQLAHDGPVGVIAAGERWPDGSLRPAVEDALGAGAVLTHIDPSGAVSEPCCSAEASAVRAAFQAARPDLHQHLAGSTSGRELIRRGLADDVATAAELNAGSCAAQLCDGGFVAV